MAVNTQKINAKSVLKYALMPGIIPRAKELGSSGFGYLAFLFASIYRAVRILPANHPYVNPDNIGKYGIIQVIGEAANHVKVDRKHLDQLVVFGALLVGVILMALQFVLLILAVFSGKAFAQPAASPPFTSMFQTPYPESDIAFLMLDYIFGIPATGGAAGSNAAFFGSNALVASGGPTPFHQGMHALFQFYNLAMLLVAAGIFLYYVFVVVVETAQTGVPFGRRFSKIYAPFRLIAAIGLLVPLNYGFNAAQYITLYAAKLGSSFATNGWILYNKNVANPMGVDNQSLIAMPRTPALDELVYFSSIYHACREMYAISKERDYNQGQNKGVCIAPYIVVNGGTFALIENDCEGAPEQPNQPGQPPANNPITGIKKALSGIFKGKNGSEADYDYPQAKKDFGNRDIEVILGEYSPKLYGTYAGSVKPYCGKMTISMSNNNPGIYQESAGTPANGGPAQPSYGPEGIRAIEDFYYKFTRIILNPKGVSFTNANNQTQHTSTRFAAIGERAAHVSVSPNKKGNLTKYDKCWQKDVLGDAATCNRSENWGPPLSSFQQEISRNRTSTEQFMRKTYEAFRTNLNLKMTPEMEKRGWGGAGIWFNNVADMNGAFTGAIYATPSVKAFPLVMEDVKKQKQAQDKGGKACEVFAPVFADNKPMKFKEPGDDRIAESLNKTYQYFMCDNAMQETADSTTVAGSTTSDPCSNSGNTYTPLRNASSVKGSSANTVVDVISLIFGINGLFDIREASKSCVDGQLKPSVNPLAQLSTIGKSLVENSIRSMATAIFASFGGGIMSALNSSLGPALQAVSGMFVGIATIGLTAGFVLYYILPFLPFIYFFFAVASWVKSIFEAMVGVPLWALAHLKIDGEGFSGRSAAGGYFLILEIFLRPIVTLFGLLGGMACFTAMATMLNLLFDIVIFNTTGATPGESGSDMGTSEIESLRRGIVDQFFFTIMYAILLYMMATASFKMIDTIPSKFMRWLNTGVGTFNDNKGDPTANLTNYATIGANQISTPIFGAMTQVSNAAGGLVGQGLKGAVGKEPPAKGQG